MILTYYGKRAVSIFAGAAEQFISNLFLNHDRDGLGSRQFIHQFGQNIGCNVIRKIRRDAKRRTVFTKAFFDEQSQTVRMTSPQMTRTLDCFSSVTFKIGISVRSISRETTWFSATSQRLRQRAKARPDFQYAVLRCDQRKIRQLLQQGFILNKILSQAMLLMKRAMLFCFQYGNLPSQPMRLASLSLVSLMI